MKLSVLGLVALAISVSADLAMMNNFTNQYRIQQRAVLASRYQGCTSKNVGVRREWGAMSKKDRVAYTDAVLCLQSKPSKASPSLVPGSRSRFDDFQAIHINQTMRIHFNAQFFPWHRYFLWAYESALRDECGYQGYQPYWDWSKYSDDPASSPLFDGSPYSLSGNGEAIPHGNTTYIVPLINVTVNIPPGTGGGCVQGGPFVNMTVNLGPVKSSGALPGWVGSGDGLDYNPRCLSRDINPAYSREKLSYNTVSESIARNQNYSSFSTDVGTNGVHQAGHFTIGGLQLDLWESPGDPAFYLHHAQIDRIWSIWQSLDPTNRQYQLQGSTTWFNIPPSPDITLDFPIDLWFEAEARAVRTFMSNIDGPLCTIYE